MLDCPLSGSGSQALLRDSWLRKRRERAYDPLPASVLRHFPEPRTTRTVRQRLEMKVCGQSFGGDHTAAAGEAFTMARKVGS